MYHKRMTATPQPRARGPSPAAGTPPPRVAACRARLRRRAGRLLGAAAVLVAAALAVWWFLPRPDLYPPGLRFSQCLEDRDGRIVHLALAPDGRYRLFTRLDQINPAVVEATLQLEDRHFRRHPGVNPLSLARALGGAVTGTPRGGGSTITMQVARLRWGLRTRSVAGKAVQIVRALQLERHFPKDRILEAYFNLAPYGGNVEGVGAAALLWCGRPVAAVGAREAIALAVLPQSPARRRPAGGDGNDALAAAQFRLRERLREPLGLRGDPLDAAFTLRPVAGPPREVPHLARRLFHDQRGEGVVRSTVDSERQRTLERAVGDFLAGHREVGITNACAILVDAPSREVRAYVGSAGFLDAAILGQVDGVTARRSPGSALKPFVYALAMDQGLIHPRSLLRDSRLSFGDYNPENFDRTFVGPIPACDALYHSRNIPAVSLMSRLHPPGFYRFLKDAGVALPKPETFYGLSLPLGGGEVSMEELGVLYSMLADDGCPRPLRYRRDEPAPAVAPARLLTPEACFLAREMLLPRADDLLADDPAVSWKTGTSHGFRDAWAAGIRGDQVLVVWIGNFDGRANPAFVARESAAPLLFEALRLLRLPDHPAGPPAGVARVELCAVSGQLPTPHCQHRQQGWFIPGVSPIAPCAIHREILVDAASGLRVVADDGQRALRRVVHEFWPPDLLELFRQAGLPRREPPPLEANARALAAASQGDAPLIVSPKEALVYTLRAHEPDRNRLALRADAAAGTTTVFWFADGRFLGSCPPTEPFLWPSTPGDHVVQVIDDHGRAAACRIRVEMVE